MRIYDTQIYTQYYNGYALHKSWMLAKDQVNPNNTF